MPDHRSQSRPSFLPLLPALVVLFVAPVAAACGDAAREAGSASAEWTAAVDTIGDTIRVRTTGGRMWLFDARLVSEVSIGVLDGAPEYQFGDIRALAVAPDGRMYVLDGHGPVVRMYAPDGSYLQDVGREGEGPGEYKRPDSGLAFLPDGRLALRDPGNGRISVYEADGAYADSWPIAGSMNTSSPMVATRTGVVLTPVIKNLGAGVDEWERGMARYHPDGTIDTVDVPDLGFEEPMISGESENSMSRSNVPFSPNQQTAYSPLGYFVAGISDDYSFMLLRADEPVVDISMDHEPVPVKAEEAEIERARITKNFEDNFPGWTWNGPPIPDVKPAYGDLLVSEEGRIWVRVSVPSERHMTEEERRAEEERTERPVNPYRPPVVFDVFEPTGEYLGRVETPDGFRLYPRPVIRDRTVWAVVTDELDVPRLHRFAVQFENFEQELAANAP
ncbi:MAG: hypothetical protein ACODAA_01900 [Gemmatimonadota bacterium]